MTATPNTEASVQGGIPITFRQFMVSVYCTHGYQRNGNPSHRDIGRTSILDLLGPVHLNAVESVVVDLGRLARRKDFTEPKSAEEIVGMIALEGEYGHTRGVTAEQTAVVYELWDEYLHSCEIIELGEEASA